MSNSTSRADFFNKNPAAKAWSVLDDALNQQMGVTPGCPKLEEGCFEDKTAIIIGSGVSGLTTAYELLAKKTGMKVTVLEAQNRTGGRCLTLRTGDTLTQDEDSELFNSKKGSTQVVRFSRPQGDNEPYLNAGPGRIPSGHKRLLQYLKTFGVDVEVYVMDSGSNLVQTSDGYGGNPVVSRRLDQNTRGHVAEMVFKNAEILIDSLNTDGSNTNCSADNKISQADKLKDLMVSFGDLSPNGDYNVGEAPDGQDENLKASDRAGFSVLPGVDSGVVAEMLNLNSLLDSGFWKVNFYQPQDFLWQPTLFQPVGGMDQVQHAFAQQVAALGGTIHLNSPVKKIDWDEQDQQFEVHVSQLGSDQCEVLKADYCFSNVAIPFLEEMLSDRLQGSDDNKGFDERFKSGLKAVYKAQNTPEVKDGFPDRFLACTTKIGWQAERSLWQGGPVATCHHEHIKRPNSEKGVVPIFGGISRTDNEIVQIWYPSNDYHDQKGVLTGCYNYSKNAYVMGNLPIDTRLDRAREGAKLFGKKFGEGLKDGVAIAWQHMPYIKGGWAQWHLVGNDTKESVRHFNNLTQGTGVDGSKEPNFFIVGDQLSSLPGWQEGAIAAALNALSRAADCNLPIPHLASLPDTRVMVEGV